MHLTKSNHFSLIYCYSLFKIDYILIIFAQAKIASQKPHFSSQSWIFVIQYRIRPGKLCNLQGGLSSASSYSYLCSVPQKQQSAPGFTLVALHEAVKKPLKIKRFHQELQKAKKHPPSIPLGECFACSSYHQ